MSEQIFGTNKFEYSNIFPTLWSVTNLALSPDTSLYKLEQLFFFPPFCLEVCRRFKRLQEFARHCRVIAKTYLPKLLSNGDNPLESVSISDKIAERNHFTLLTSLFNTAQGYIRKHRKNCKCCPRHSLFKGHNVNVKIVVLNSQKCNQSLQCLKCQDLGNQSLGLLFEGVL